ncbi:SDR family oxidoreductase [Lysinibacter sp. HNR]|uniref:SDR family oxidoreductase n=1 Tax=Lysinibacter sp. HNR TaxID=3031408 RepID=UPI0024359BF4|nr:SDR family oxidoreductase [Lysinibacter sp. HNR]WGD37537.1 SDR family oxidoreductase [Lysinibacter sp. HNR]
MLKPLVVITGASSGIGAATAQTFSRNGHALLLLARRADRLDALNLPHTMTRAVDVTDRDALAAAVHEAEEVYGPVETIVNNAGIMLLGRIAEQAAEEWDTMFNVNVLGLLNGIKAVLPGMVDRGSGTIINISSVAGRKTFPNHTAYVGTKFAVHAMSENLREEVSGSGVRVITIAPGAVETELLSHTTNQQIKDDYETWKESAGGVLDPQVVAEAILFANSQPANVTVREIVLASTGQSA